jgi:integrase
MADRQIRYFSQQEVRRFFSKIQDKRDRALFDVTYKYGLRRSEVQLIQLHYLDLGRGRIYIRRLKNGVSGEKPLFRDTKRLLRDYLEERLDTGSALFTGRQGNLGPQRIQQLFKRYARKARLDSGYSVHALRHSIATHLLDAGQSVEVVQDHLGHRNIQSTMVYAKITDRRRAEMFEELEGNSAIVKLS